MVLLINIVRNKLFGKEPSFPFKYRVDLHQNLHVMIHSNTSSPNFGGLHNKTINHFTPLSFDKHIIILFTQEHSSTLIY